VLGKAERWDGPEEEPVPEPAKIDMSILAGKRVNKVGNVVDSRGEIYGRLVEGDPKVRPDSDRTLMLDANLSPRNLLVRCATRTGKSYADTNHPNCSG
jgi:Protein of unknown function (DUF3659)